MIKSLSDQYKSAYEPGGPGRLEAFFTLIKSEFEKVESTFIEKTNISADKEAIKRIRAIAKAYAKKCVDDYGKIKA